MTREAFHRALEGLQRELLEMGEMVDAAIHDAVESLKLRDLEWSRRVIENDEKINHLRFDIEEKSITAIATQQPVASDLRTIVAILNIIVELERMADHAAGIAKINLMIGAEPLVKPLIDIPRMAEKSRAMLRRSLQAFVTRDVGAAKEIWKEDDEIDALYHQIFRELLTYMIEDPRLINRATHLIWAAHNLERIADRVTNICERVVYLVSGRMEEKHLV